MLAIDDLLAWQRFVIDQPGAANKAFSPTLRPIPVINADFALKINSPSSSILITSSTPSSPLSEAGYHWMRTGVPLSNEES